MAAIALCLDRPTEDALLDELVAAGHELVARVQTGGELAAVLAASRVDLAVVTASRSRLTPAVPAAAAAAGSRLVATVSSDEEHEAAVRLAVREIARTPCSWDDIERLLSSPSAPPLEDVQGGSPASVVAVWGPTGAPGRTTLAVSLAAELAAMGDSVLLVDADAYGGAMAPLLGLLDEAPGFASACRLAGSDALTRAELDRVACYLPAASPLAVLTGLAQPSRWPELGTARVVKTLAACASWFDHVIVDVGFSLETDEEIASDLFAPRRNACTLAVLGAATQLIAVGAADPVGLPRLLRALPELERLAPQAPARLVLNRVRASTIGARPEAQLTTALQRFAGLVPDALIPEDTPAFDAAVLQARPLRDVAPRSRAALAVRALAASIAKGAPAPAASSMPASSAALP